MANAQRIWISLLLAIVTFIILTNPINAISITPSKIVIDYEPGVEKQFSFDVGRADSIEIYLKDELAPYAAILDSAPKSGPRTFSVTLTPPAGLSPGRHALIVGAIEAAPVGMTVGGRAAVQAPIYVEVPYPGVYIEASLSSQTINVGEIEPFVVTVTNKGTDSISQVYVKLKVFDSDNNTVAELSSDSKPLEGVSSVDFNLNWDSTGAKAGPYSAAATVFYDGGAAEAKANFKIGSLLVLIKRTTDKFEAGAITPFFIEVESGWNAPIQGMYGELKFADKSFKTPAFDLAAWKTINITGYADASGIPEGEYDARFIVYYADKTTEKTSKITLGTGAGVAKPAVTEKPSLVSGATMTTALLVMLTGVFVAALVTLIIIARRKK